MHDFHHHLCIGQRHGASVRTQTPSCWGAAYLLCSTRQENGTRNIANELSHCTSTSTKKRTKETKLGYAIFFCPQCRSTFNERTGTSFHYLEAPTDIVLLVVFWRLRYTLSLRDVAEMFLQRGFLFTHETVRDWEARFAPLIADQLRAKRRGQAGISWYVDAHVSQSLWKVVLSLSSH